MHQSILGVLVLYSLIHVCVSVHVAFDLSGWKAMKLDNNRVRDSTNLAVEHLGGQLKQPITAFKLEEVSLFDKSLKTGYSHCFYVSIFI